MAAYHQHYLQSSFDQPRVIRACEIPAVNIPADARFEMSHQGVFNPETEAKGFSACCKNNYGKFVITYNSGNCCKIF